MEGEIMDRQVMVSAIVPGLLHLKRSVEHVSFLGEFVIQFYGPTLS